MSDGLKDLAIVPITSSDTNYFLRKVTGIKIDKTYSFKFQWVFEDGLVSDWSPGYQVLTPTESVPSAPLVVIPSTNASHIPVTLSVFPEKAKRVDIYIIGGAYGSGRVADSFLQAGTKTIAAAAGTYQVSLITVTPSGINGTPSQTFTITIADVGETIQDPTNPNGFSIDRILSGIQVNWDGTYSNGTFTGFEAIKIYVGNLATASVGSYKEAGVMTGNNVKNAITIPVDGTYLRYDQPVYIHAAAVNKNGAVGTIQANVASNLLGARSAVSSDLANQIITNAKLVDDAITAAKIATGAITVTKILDGSITTPKIVANSITSDLIISSAIIADKIATNAITATKIKAGEIDVTKLSAGTISVNNLEAGNINATSFIRAGSKASNATGARVEISSATVSEVGKSGNVLPGFYIYDSIGTPVLSAPLSGGLSINGGGIFSGDISGANGTFTGGLSVGSGTIAFITNAIGDGSRVTYNGINTLSVGDVVTISGIANNGPFLNPGSNPATYYYTFNAYNISNAIVTDVTATTFKVASGVTNFSTQSYTSGGTVTGVGFKVYSSGIFKAYAGNIGGWQIDQTQLRSRGSNYISLNPLTPQISLVNPSEGTITIDPVQGIKDSAGNFTLSPNGNLSLKGSITSGSTITGAQISGSRITSTGNEIYDGTLTINSGFISHTSGIFISANAILMDYAAGVASFLLMSNGGVILGQGNATGDLQIRLNPDPAAEGFLKGYHFHGLETTAYRSSGQHISNNINYATVLVEPSGRLVNGRTFYFGTSSTSTTINNAIGGNLGDIYFSTV